MPPLRRVIFAFGFVLALIGAGMVAKDRADAQGYSRELMNPPGWVLKPIPAIDCNFANFAYYNCPLDTTFSLTRASAETVTWADGHLSYAASGQLAISDLGLQVWESRTNSVIQSSALTNAAWTSTSAWASSASATGPDNVSNSAVSFVPSTSSGLKQQYNSSGIILTAASYTWSVWAKNAGYNFAQLEATSGSNVYTAVVNLTTGAITQNNSSGSPSGTSSSATIYPNGWVQILITMTAQASDNYVSLQPCNSGTPGAINCSFAGNGTSGVTFFGPQIERGSFPSPYIPTTTTSATRAADNIALINSALGLVGAAQGSIVAFTGSLAAPGAQSYPVLLALNNHQVMGGSSTSTISLYGNDTSGSNGLTATLGTGTFAASYKQGLAWSSAGRSYVGNAGTVATNTHSLINNAVTSSALGSENGSLLFLDGTIQRFVLSPLRFPDPQLQMLTSLN